MILQTNLEAARETARQIRLRDIGGLLIVDFIDMYSHQNRRVLFEEFKKCFANDRAKNSILPVSDFGLVEMTRERTKPSIMYTLSESCPTCEGFGRIMSKETVAMKVERWFMRAKVAKAGKKFEIQFHPEMVKFMRNNEGDRIREIEKALRLKIEMVADESFAPHQYKIINVDENVDVTALYQTAK
jgi:ribonuclease G